ncbi:MAG: sulfatase-like hydrolase/transferase [Candidatus Latescibacterota bacterium]|nr:MAG: sulfatase-like hydrolase/transferase [Candidatus Latescibacterota bacterium]
MKSKPAKFIVASLSVFVTPWIFFVATANSLFLSNQADLDYRLVHYLPFVYAFIATAVLGLGLYVLAQMRARFRFLLWGFYLLGVCFFVFTETSHNPNLVKNHGQWVAFLLALTILFVDLLQNVSPAKIAPLFAIYALFLIATDSYHFLRQFEFNTGDARVIGKIDEMGAPTEPQNASSEFRNVSGVRSTHNIYHLVLDGYQSDLFMQTLDDSIRNELAGFTVFPNNITISGRTSISIPSVFAGKTRDVNSSVAEYTAEAMNSEKSLLSALKKAGYSTTAYLHRGFAFEPNLFDRTYYHHNAARHRDLGDDVFCDLWIYRFLPRFVSAGLLDAETITEIVHRSLSPKSYAVVSHDTFLSFVKREPDSDDTNRYTFLHLLLPHHPYVLGCECDYLRAVEPLEQFRCATHVITTLVQLLKDLGRFHQSLIIVQGDHGLGLKWLHDGKLRASHLESADLEWHRLRSQTLMLIKPSRTGTDTELCESTAKTSLLDITPTIYRSLNVTPPTDLEGQDLFPTALYEDLGERYYYYYDGAWEDEVFRFVIGDTSFALDGILRPEGLDDHIPTTELETVVEAEDGLVTTSENSLIGSDREGTSGQHLFAAKVHVRVRVDQPGTFGLKARLIVPDEKSSLQARMNEGPYEGWQATPCSEWEWQNAPFRWELGEGDHILVLRTKGRALLDQFEVTPLPRK